jgi:hypothetical protein
VVDRVQRYDGTGDAVAGTGDDPVASPAPIGLASTPALPARAARWVFPDAVVAEGTRTQVAVYNPGSRTARVDVVLVHQDPARFPEVEPVQLTLRPRSEEVVDLSQVVGISPGVPFTIDVRSLDDVAIIAEQLSFGVPGATPSTGSPDQEAAPLPEPVEGFAVVPGAPVAASTWFLASRGSSSLRAATVVVANPGPRPVEVEVTELTDGRRSRVAGASVTIEPGDRRELDLSAGATSSALLVTADAPVVVGHSVVGVRGRGIAQALGTPFPETVASLPAPE